jgi:hypothetical protein
MRLEYVEGVPFQESRPPFIEPLALFWTCENFFTVGKMWILQWRDISSNHRRTIRLRIGVVLFGYAREELHGSGW